ncbi:tyrosine phosphatase [Tubulinosema ratisbonensis]|uniref:Tyrosine phosphatase n=1 Tax=Tubulinosema ratisbonensis TaxID=291195 RepID=A0A437AKH6_9MICR|nr:tyrosine phosphatase [Tubulinosema ratisbonensis]
MERFLKKYRKEILNLFKNKKYYELIVLCTELMHKFMIPRCIKDRTNITPYDRSIMTKFNLQEYVNASLLEKYKFIAAQLPKPEFKEDFFRLILNSECKLIISLVDCKDEDYFEENELVERKVIFYHKEESFYDELYKFKGKFLIRRLRYLNWNDFSIPCGFEFSNFVNYYSKIKNDSFVIVHCLAGVGRTGTFIMYDILSKYEKVTDENFIDLFLELRSFRNCLVYNDLQFKFLVLHFMQK